MMSKPRIIWGDDDPYIPQSEFEFIAKQLAPMQISSHMRILVFGDSITQGYWWYESKAFHETMRTIHRDIVSALIFSRDGKLLMGMKDPNSGGVYADCWHIPGGGVDEGEAQEQALHREILEEVGIDITGCKVALADNQGSGETEKMLKDTGEKVLCKMKFYVYRVDVDSNAASIEIKPNDDLVKLEWVELADLGKYKLTPPSEALFKRLGL